MATSSYSIAPGSSSEDQALRRKLAAALLQQGTDVSPVAHPMQGLARMLQAGMGGYELGAIKRDEDTEKESGRKMFADYLDRQASGGTEPHPLGPVTPGPRPATAPPAIEPQMDATVPIGTTEPAPAQPTQMAGGAIPAAIRFNNPGAQYPGPSANAFGATGSATIGGGHKIANFPDPVSGAAAQFHLLGRAYAGLPLAQAIAKWSGGNNAGQYTAAVSRATGISPETVLTPELLQSPQGIALVRAMAKHETGREFPMQPEQWQQAQSRAFGGPQPVQMAQAGGSQPRPMGSIAAQPSINPQQAAELKSLLGNKFTAPMAQQAITAIMQKNMVPKDPKWEKLDESTLYDQGTGRTMPVGGERRPLTDPAERARYGIPADDKRPYQLGPNNRLINPPPETRVNVDQRGEGAFATQAATVNAKRFDELVKGGYEAQSMVADLGALRDIGSRITTGKTAQVTQSLGPYAEALGVKIDGLDDLQAYQAIVSRMAPRMRPPGSGATSDFEMRQFLSALPQLGTTPQGNEMIANTLEALQQHRVAAADIGSRALAGELTPREAEKALRELPNPMELWRKSRGALPSANPADLKKKYGLE
jgi:hypothetical protein